MYRKSLPLCLLVLLATATFARAAELEIRTPKAPATPRINGPTIFGVTPGNPVVYTIPATGERPMEFAVDNLPPGLKVDAKTGQISGSVKDAGTHTLTLRAKNAKGSAEKKFKLVVGGAIALTPPMGWNSWNVWGDKLDGQKVKDAAKAMVDSGLINHGWTYINIDDAWQGKRGGKFQGLQGNDRFGDLQSMCDEIHKMGLKVGIYSTPWVTSYARYPGGSSENEKGDWEKPTGEKTVNKKILPWAIGKHSFAKADAQQWAEWGIDYLKYDWSPNELPETKEMHDALRSSGRDVVFSLSNNTPFDNIPDLCKLANCWRTSGDIRDRWDSVISKGFALDRWAPHQSAGHWNDPDMLVVGHVGWGSPHPSNLTPDEQYTHITCWCLVASPLLIGCDMTKLDEFTLNLLTNDEVLAVSQDPLGKQAKTVVSEGKFKVERQPDRSYKVNEEGPQVIRVLARDMEDGSKAVGLFNVGSGGTVNVKVTWSDLGISGPQQVRDLWRQKDLGQFESSFELPIPPHGAEMVRIKKATGE